MTSKKFQTAIKINRIINVYCSDITNSTEQFYSIIAVSDISKACMISANLFAVEAVCQESVVLEKRIPKPYISRAMPLDHLLLYGTYYIVKSNTLILTDVGHQVKEVDPSVRFHQWRGVH